MVKIEALKCNEILDSRGEWTIETKVLLDNNTYVSQTIPSGASKGENEAISLPADKAAEIVETVLSEALKGEDPCKQTVIDELMIEMDGTPNLSNLGCNSILSVSLGVAKAAAKIQEKELYDYLHELFSGRPFREVKKFPTPVFNVLNGGKHAQNKLSFQEFMVIPALTMPYDKGLELGVTIYHQLKTDLEAAALSTGVGDEGGFAPTGLNTKKALTLIKAAASKHYKVGEEVFFGMDVAAESFHITDAYKIKEERKTLSSEALGVYYEELLKTFEIIYLEDPFYEHDYAGWMSFFSKMGSRLMVVADDLVVTNFAFLQKAIEQKLANAVIIKPNQVGTLTQTFRFVRAAQAAGMSTIVSHRSGETAEDTFIADLALGVEADFIKAGAPVRGERVVKYNRLLEVFNSEK